ncbi:glycerol acyltransferase [Mycolicibacterium sp. (ex Dasyatis americana)]|nr:glycerol acyltransferase [Mycolicibacterium sp. (ex Dasyatis americana)]
MMDGTELDQWDPDVARQVKSLADPIVKWWFRSEVRGLENIPGDGAALVVANHSGGMLTPDVLVFAPAYYRHFGYERPLYTLAHYGVLLGPTGALLRRLGIVHASRENAAAALHSGALVLVFPGGDYDAYRPTAEANTIDFNGRTGYVRTALAAGVPIVPTVSIGAQESQLFLTRGHRLAKRLGLPRFRLDILPVSIGIPFGLSVIVPPNLPLPTKVITEVLPPIDITARFGTDPDIHEVDAHIRTVMQTALDRLASQRRFPILG